MHTFTVTIRAFYPIHTPTDQIKHGTVLDNIIKVEADYYVPNAGGVNFYKHSESDLAAAYTHAQPQDLLASYYNVVSVVREPSEESEESKEQGRAIREQLDQMQIAANTAALAYEASLKDGTVTAESFRENFIKTLQASAALSKLKSGTPEEAVQAGIELAGRTVDRSDDNVRGASSYEDMTYECEKVINASDRDHVYCPRCDVFHPLDVKQYILIRPCMAYPNHTASAYADKPLPGSTIYGETLSLKDHKGKVINQTKVTRKK